MTSSSSSPPTTRPPRLGPDEVAARARPARRRAEPAERPAPVSRRSADGRVVVDSRLRARRVGVRIDEGRRRLRRFLWLGGVVVVAALLAASTQSPLLAVRHVRVTGGHHTSVAEIEAAAGIRTGRPMVGADTAAAAARVRRLPWVRTASVRRVWPTTIRITVTERTPVAQISDGGRWAQVDLSGRVVARVPASTPGLTRLVGAEPADPGATVAGAGSALRLAQQLPPSVRSQVAWVAIDAGGDLALRITTGGTVVVGSLANLDAKLVAVATMLHNLKPHSFCTIDVQVPNAPTLTRVSACA